MDSGEVIGVDSSNIEVLSNMWAKVLGYQADTKGFPFTGPPILLMLVKTNREVAPQKFSFRPIFICSRNHHIATNSFAKLRVIGIDIELISGFWDINCLYVIQCFFCPSETASQVVCP